MKKNNNGHNNGELNLLEQETSKGTKNNDDFGLNGLVFPNQQSVNTNGNSNIKFDDLLSGGSHTKKQETSFDLV